jgi:predicted porin
VINFFQEEKTMVKHKKLGMAVAGACALFGASAANAFGPIKAGDWDLSVGGEVNAFYSYTHCDNNANAVAGGLACTTSNQKSSSSVRSGLLPSALVFSAKTTQEGFDIGVTFGFYPGINSSQPNAVNANGPGSPLGLGTTGIDMRQNFLTFGDKEMGTIKMGRDLGFFGSDAILSDITLLGVGSGGAAAPGNTSLGRIGVGYIYADWDPQISYISTNHMGGVGGLQGSIGIFQPYSTLDFAGVGDPALTAHQTPGMQGKLTYDYDTGGVTGRAWAGFFYQKFDSFTVGQSGATGVAGDFGIKAAVAGWEPVIYYYQARGVGTTAFGFNGINLAGNKRNSNGGYVQLAYKIPGTKWKPGISYGVSRLALASNESNATKPTLVNRNRSAVAQLQYSLTKALTLVGEYVYTKDNNQVGVANSNNTYSLGAILFF